MTQSALGAAIQDLDAVFAERDRYKKILHNREELIRWIACKFPELLVPEDNQTAADRMVDLRESANALARSRAERRALKRILGD